MSADARECRQTPPSQARYRRRMIDEMVAHFGNRRGVATPTHGARTTRTSGPADFCNSRSRFSPPSIAHVEESQTRMVSGGTFGSALLHDIEMSVERCRFKDFGKCRLHLVGKRRQMRGRNLLICILNEMQMFDQQIAMPRSITQKHRNLFGSLRIDLTPLGVALARRRPSPGCSNERTFWT